MSLSTTYIHVYIREKVCRSQAIHEQASQKLKEHGCLHMTPTHPPPRAQEVLQATETHTVTPIKTRFFTHTVTLSKRAFLELLGISS